MEILATLLIRMRDDGSLARARWIHMFGTGRLEASLVYTAIRRAIESGLGKDMPLSFDCSTPFTDAGERRRAFGLPVITSGRLTIPSLQAPDSPRLCRSDLPFPYPMTSIGNLLSIGDICVNENVHADHAWDNLSLYLVCNHNMEMMTLAYEAAHRVFDLPREFSKQSIPGWILEFNDLVDELLRSDKPMSLISRNRKLLSNLGD